VAVDLASLSPEVTNYEHHELHNEERIWTETNCYVDLWVELLHTIGLEPLAASAFVLSADFEGDQWSFLKYPPEDLRMIYGIEVAELNVWRPLLWHIADQLGRNRLLTVEMDSHYLPDTRGVSYQIDHTKTTLVPWSIDPDRREMTYFHNAGFFSVDGDDFDGLFRLGHYESETALPPYVEIVKLDAVDPGPPDIAATLELAATHFSRRPSTNPVGRMREQIEEDLSWLADQELEIFHQYAFATCRQCGAGAELAATYLGWLEGVSPMGLSEASALFQDLASSAKALQFALARTVRGRSVDVSELFATMASSWELANEQLERCFGS
jgi:hypothetical protein